MNEGGEGLPIVFKPEWLDELKSRCDIVDIVSRYVPLKKNGREYVGCCPFHHERTPSFMVYAETQSYHCFGCKESGDVIQFVKKYENLSFMDAVEHLASIANVPLPQKEEIDTRALEAQKNKRNQILNCLKLAARFYYSSMQSGLAIAKLAREYVAKRELQGSTLTRFGVGCSPDYNSLPQFLLSKGVSEQTMLDSGVVTRSKDNAFIDFFAKRLMFPIIDKDGAVIGFSGRLLEKKDLAKYKNTSATPVFNKSEVIFGINLLKKHREERRAKGDYNGIEYIIIVEGQIDVMMMHQFGFTTTVACLGTAFTPLHARKLKQFSERVILLLDGDTAGQKATNKSIDILRKSGVNVTVARLPEGKDPDEFLRAYGKDKMQALLDSAVEGIKYKIQALAESYNLNEPSECARFVHESLLVIKALESETEQDSYLTVVHHYSSIPLEVLRSELKSLKDEVVSGEENEVRVESVKKDGYTLADLFILASILHHKAYTKDVDISKLEFWDEGLRACFDYITKSQASGVVPTLGGLYSVVDVENSTQLLKEVTNFEFLPDAFPELTFASCVLRNKERALKKQKDEAQSRCSSATENSIRENEMRKIIELTKKLEENKLELEELNSAYSQKRQGLSKQKLKRKGNING